MQTETCMYTKSNQLYKTINDRCQMYDTDSKCCNSSEDLDISVV